MRTLRLCEKILIMLIENVIQVQFCCPQNAFMIAGYILNHFGEIYGICKLANVMFRIHNFYS